MTVWKKSWKVDITWVVAGIVLFFVVFIIFGCVSVKYKPATGEIEYKRYGDQEIQGLYVVVDPNGATHIEIAKQKSDPITQMVELIKMVTK